MSRSVIKINYESDFQIVDQNVKRVLINAGYRETNKNNEIVWKKGIGMLTAMQYIKLEYDDNNILRVYGWVQTGIGTVGGKEQDLEGIYAVVPKQGVKNLMNRIKSVVR